jgi:hypothetical protein
MTEAQAEMLEPFFIASDPDRAGEALTLSIAGTSRDRGNRNRLVTFRFFHSRITKCYKILVLALGRCRI